MGRLSRRRVQLFVSPLVDLTLVMDQSSLRGERPIGKHLGDQLERRGDRMAKIGVVS